MQTSTATRPELVTALLVEADPAEVARLQTLLSDEDSSVLLQRVDSLAAALERLETAPTGALLFDWRQLAIEGESALRAIVERSPGCPLLALCSAGQEPDPKELRRHGAVDCLVRETLTAPLLSRSVRWAGELQRARLEHQAAEASRRRSQRFEALGQMAGGVAHDFNNMLAAIIGFAEIALADLDPNEPAAQSLSEIVKTGVKARSLTRKLLAFGRQAARPRLIDLGEVLSDMERLLHQTLGERIELELGHQPGALTVKADPSQLEQVILNLAVNARDAMQGGGRLRIEARSLQVSADRDARELPPGDYAQLLVSDSGSGIEREQLPKIFEPFFTSKKTGGVGLGLATVWSIVKQCRGFVFVDSQVGVGTTFEVLLPSIAGTATQIYQDESERSTLARGSETILLVDDDAVVGDVVQQLLELLGYTVIAASEPRAAIALYQQRQRSIDLVLTDLVMPEMDGVQLATELKQLNRSLKVVFMSGYADSQLASTLRAQPDLVVLEKPVRLPVLADRIRQILDAPVRRAALV